MEKETPAEWIFRWLRTPSSSQSFVRWLALIPGVVCIFVFSQLMLLMGLSLIPLGDQIMVAWASNMLNAAFVPFLIIKFGTRIAPSFRRQASVALAVVAVFVVALCRLASELSYAHQTNWRYAWLAFAAVLCGGSVWFGIRAVNRKESLRERAVPNAGAA